MAFISFLKIIAHIKKSRKLLKYKENKALNERIPNYQIKMGFGLHVGWAIEGAIGSFYKIDASYLSPHVNMASRLEAATKQFGVPLLISGQL
jgi:class 3 adenylate cyclase